MAVVFGIVFVGELPDKTMFASLVLAARGRAGLVWLGAAAAFAVHVVIAVTAGRALLLLLPYRVTQTVVAVLFAVAAFLAFREARGDGEPADPAPRSTGRRTASTAFVVIFIAEWGDLTQLLTADLAARYQETLVVGVAALAALWLVAGLAVAAGRLLRKLPIGPVRWVTGGVCLVLAVLAALDAVAPHTIL